MTCSTAEYRQLAYEQALYDGLARLAKEKLLPREGEHSPEVSLDSGFLPKAESTVPKDQVIDMVLRLQRLAHDRAVRLTRYRLVEESADELDTRPKELPSNECKDPQEKGDAKDDTKNPENRQERRQPVKAARGSSAARQPGRGAAASGGRPTEGGSK